MSGQLSEFDESGKVIRDPGRGLQIMMVLAVLAVLVTAAIIVINGRRSAAAVESAGVVAPMWDEAQAAAAASADRKFANPPLGAVVAVLDAGDVSALRWQAMAEFYAANGLLTRDLADLGAADSGYATYTERYWDAAEAGRVKPAEPAYDFYTQRYWEMAAGDEAK